jgi:hypothetical protein
MQANTLDEVITRLHTIIQKCTQRSSRMGYFACVYRKITVAIKDTINKGVFEDGPRMEKLDVFFANRCLNAYEQYVAGQKPTASWQTAFDAAATEKLTVLQHLLLGITNPHHNDNNS